MEDSVLSAGVAGTDLAGRVALVTGANHGIGAAVARRLAASGASVLLTYLRLPLPDDIADIDDGTRLRYAQMKATASGDQIAEEIRSAGGHARSSMVSRAGATGYALSQPRASTRTAQSTVEPPG